MFYFFFSIILKVHQVKDVK